MDSQKSGSVTPAEIIAGNDDLLMETFFLHLPEKILVRFQVVCKHWQSLIFSPSFSRTHSRLTRRRNSYFLLRHRISTFQFSYFYFNPSFSPTDKVFTPFSFNSPHTRIMDSCNGLLLLESRYSEYGQSSYSVYNPTTRESRVLKFRGRASNSRVCLAFDPSRSLHYKIFCFYRNSIEVYESESLQWREWTNSCPTNLTKCSNVIYRSNRLYFIQPTSARFDYMDLETGKFGGGSVTKTPSRKQGELNRNYIMESHGHVHFVAIYVSGVKGSLIVFELLEDDSGWFELYKVDISPIVSAFPELILDVGILGIVRGETEQESYVLIHAPNKVILYRFCDRSFEVVLNLEGFKPYKWSMLLFSRCDAFQMVHNLASV